jgi:ATP phosphoribosyltransferase regulatory subunit
MFVQEGYTHLELAAVENYDQLCSLYNKLKKEQIVKVYGGSDILVLRTDHTASIIKNLIPRWEPGLKLKLFYNSTVFRSSTRGEIKEIKQLGIEYLGEAALKADKEVIGLALQILSHYEQGFIIEVSNSKFIRGLIEAMAINEEEVNRIKDLIDRKNRFELIDFSQTLDLPGGIRNSLLNLLELEGDLTAIVEQAQENYLNPTMEEALAELMDLKTFTDKLGYSQHVYFDLSLLMELDYYDGLIFKGYYPNSFKEIVCGGRYDSFTEEFGQKISAVGFSLDVEELMEKGGA